MILKTASTWTGALSLIVGIIVPLLFEHAILTRFFEGIYSLVAIGVVVAVWLGAETADSERGSKDLNSNHPRRNLCAAR